MTKILVVDDNSANRDLVVTLIKHRGHEPLEAADGAEALRLVRVHHPELVISDILMPTMDGYEFVRQLRADPELACTEVIFYTAHYRGREARNLARACGVSQVLVKPCPADDILRAIDSSLAHTPALAPLSDAMQFDREHLRLMSDKLSENLEDLRGANQRLAALTDLNLHLASEHDPQVLLDKVCRGARELIGAKYAVLGIDGKSGGSDAFFVSGIDDALLASLERPQMATGVLGQVRADGRPRRAMHSLGDPAVVGLPAGYPPVYASLIVPVASLTRRYGWICLVDKLGAQEFNEDDEHILSTLVAQAGRIYENGNLYIEVQRHAEELQIEIAERKAQQSQLYLSRQVLEQSRESILVADTQFNIVMVNKAFTDISGYTQAEVLGKSLQLLDSQGHDGVFFKALQECVSTLSSWSGELWSRRRNGTEFPAWMTISVVRDALGQACNYVFISNDISEQKATQEKISWLSNFDTLTGLPNATLLGDRCTHDLSTAQRDGKAMAMMVLGIDQFELVNDTMGHAVGNQLLKQFAKRLADTLREQDTVARVDGHEFAMVLPGSTPEGASLLATRLLHILAQPYQVGDATPDVTASIGIAMYPDDGREFDVLFKFAVVAMHQAKELGNGKHRFFNAQSFESTLAQAALATALRTAIARDELALHYQPFGDLQTGRIAGMEALLRWTHPELGSVSPGRFIPVAEHSGLIMDIGAWVLRQVCQDIRAWQRRGILVPCVSVNISPVQFRDAQLPQSIDGVLREFGIEPDMICLEVTEGVLMEDVTLAETMLHALRALGVKLSLDDFGTGYSSLSYLHTFPFDKVKIDQSFVRDIVDSTSDAVIAKVIISLSHGLGLRVIAEGVETEVQCKFMRDNACDEIQGYFFSRPVPMADMETLLVSDGRLPDQLLRVQTRPRTLLLVDDESNIIAALRRLLRRDGYEILSAYSGVEGLELLKRNPVDIIVSDQRMPGMSGVEFLRQAKRLYPATTRIMLSGYTDLESVTNAINEGAVYRFLIKPWDDDQLRDFIADAFRQKGLADENVQLNLKIRTANQELACSNRQLQAVLNAKQEQFARSEISLGVVRDALQCLPIPVIGIDDEGLIAFVNIRAQQLFAQGDDLLGSEMGFVLPTLDALLKAMAPGESDFINLGELVFRVQWHRIGEHSTSRGKLVTLSREETQVCLSSG